MTKRFFFIISLLCVSLTSQAENNPNNHGLSGDGEVSVYQASGNDEQERYYTALRLNYLQQSYEIKSLLEAKNQLEQGVRTSERYVGDLQGNLFFISQPKAYGFGQSRWESDRFEDVALNSYYLFGLGYKFINDQQMTLTAETGAGYQSEDYLEGSTTEDFQQAIAKFYANFGYRFNKQVRFTQDATEFYGEKQIKLETNTALLVKLNSKMNLKLSYKYRHNSKPAEGNVKEDTETNISLIYNF